MFRTSNSLTPSTDFTDSSNDSICPSASSNVNSALINSNPKAYGSFVCLANSISFFRFDFIPSTNLSNSTSVPVGSIFTINSNLAIFYGPEKPHELHEYAAAASLQLPHLQISSALHSGQLNFTFLSPGMMCLLHPLHTGSEILEDILKPPVLGIYTFLGDSGFALHQSLNFST